MLKEIENQELIPTLIKAGIKAKEYSKSGAAKLPLGTDFLVSTIAGGKSLIIKPGAAAILKLAVDKKRHQAVLSVLEGDRVMKEKVTFKFMSKKETNVQFTEHELKMKAIKQGSMQVSNARRDVEDIKLSNSKAFFASGKANPTGYELTYTATVVYTVKKPKSATTFLMGIDETSHFISELPSEVDTVKAAHDLLRPQSIKVGTKRQGEFFFVPAASKDVKEVLRNNNLVVRASMPLEFGSNHHAKEAVVKRSTHKSNSNYTTPLFVRGLIFDKRAYRHAPVDLKDRWHRVVRNTEKVVKNAAPRRVRYD